MDLRWTPEEKPEGVMTTDPGVLTALRKQLGLRLEKRTHPVDMLVVDHAEQSPSPN